MSESFIGEIRMFGGNFAPYNWAFCNGQLLLISEYDALYALIGTTYGGDGVTTFALPDLRGRLPISQGQGAGLSSHPIGSAAGSEDVTLTTQQMPAHTHAFHASTAPAKSPAPNGNVFGATGDNDLYATSDASTEMNKMAIGFAGATMPHQNMMPFLCVSFIISLYGIYPTQS